MGLSYILQTQFHMSKHAWPCFLLILNSIWWTLSLCIVIWRFEKLVLYEVILVYKNWNKSNKCIYIYATLIYHNVHLIKSFIILQEDSKSWCIVLTNYEVDTCRMLLINIKWVTFKILQKFIFNNELQILLKICFWYCCSRLDVNFRMHLSNQSIWMRVRALCEYHAVLF